MNKHEIYRFLEAHILKSTESIDDLYIQEQNNLMFIPVMKQTARMISKKAELVVSKREAAEDIPTEICRLFHSPNVKKTESELKKQFSAEKLYELVEQGMLLKEVRFKQDGKTVGSTMYRMGYALSRYIEKQKAAAVHQEREMAEQWLIRKREAASGGEEGYISKLKSVLDEIEAALSRTGDVAELLFLRGLRWQKAKSMLFLEFLLALYAVGSRKRAFDWKEIGAVYYQEIGGSKRFDVHKRDFLELAEAMLELPLHYVGLVSLGTVTPILFVGDLHEADIHYRAGTVRSTTDLAVFRYSYRTDAEVLWLVENRAVLTRMAAEEGFLEETKSLVIGVDGQLRSGHKRLIQSVLSHSASIHQIIIWTDADQAGDTIGTHLFEAVRNDVKQIKWIVPDGERVVHSWEEYSSRLAVRDSEQEEQLEGGDVWKAWIKA